MSTAHDPAKLAELLAMALRARGVVVYINADDPGDDLVLPCMVFVVEIDTIEVYEYLSWRSVRSDQADIRSTLTLPEFRALLSAVMATPTNASSLDQVLALIRGET